MAAGRVSPQIQASGIGVGYGDRDVLSDVTVNIGADAKMALVGGNGSGKTTLMRILAGETAPHSGEVVTSSGTDVAYLAQSIDLVGEDSLYETAERAFAELHAIADELEAVTNQIAAGAGDLATLVERQQELVDTLDRHEYRKRVGSIDRVLTGLGFSPDQFAAPLSTLSGGMQMRAHLAATVLRGADIMLLDEPTNYLDLPARRWLVGFLRSYPGGYVVVSHDRSFLDETTQDVVELFLGRARRYRGNYSDYERLRRAELESLKAQRAQQLDEIARDEAFIRRFRYNASKAKQVQSRIRRLEKVVPIELPPHLTTARVRLPDAPRMPREVLALEGAGKHYDHTVFRGVDISIERGERVAIIGRNGLGKTTLLRILAGVDQNHEGERRTGSGVSVSYFAQDVTEGVDGGLTVYQAVEQTAPAHFRPQLRDLLGAMLFHGDDIEKPCSVLSGGEMSRVALCRAVTSPAGVLVLDEPTNHLDISSKDALLAALEQYTGAIVFVSHDVHFIEGLAQRIVELVPGDTHDAGARIIDYPGGWDYYTYRNRDDFPGAGGDATGSQNRTAGAQTSPGSLGSPGSPPDTPAIGADGVDHRRFREIRAQARKARKREEELLARIDELESERERIQDELSDPDVYRDGDRARRVTARMGETEELLAEAHEAWEQTAQEAEELEAAAGT